MNTKFQADSLLLVSASERRFELQSALQEALHLQVSVVTSFPKALTSVAQSPYRAAILDESLADLDPAGSDQFLACCTDAFPIFVTLAITGVSRCLKQIQLALRRFDREQRIAELSARDWVRSQFRDGLTSILIYAQLALKTPDVPTDAAKHINSVLEAAEALQQAMSPIPDSEVNDSEHLATDI
jgi:hypothetical protein